MGKNASLMSQDNDKLIALTAKNLAYLMNKNGVDASAMSAATGLGIATINSLRRGVGNPTLLTMMELATFFNVTLSELTEIDLSEHIFKHSKARSIPLIKINDLNKFIDKNFYGHETYTTEIDGPDKKLYFAVLVNNDSLYPKFSTGTVFIVSKEDEPCDGDIVLVKISNHNPCFRKIFIDGNNFLFSSILHDNEIKQSTYLNYKLVGVVLKAIKTFSER